MRAWLGLLIFGMVAHAEPGLLTTQVGTAGAFQLLRTPDCQRIYFAPREYVFDPAGTKATYQRRTESNGAFDVVKPVVVLDVQLVPVRNELSQAEHAQAMAWAATQEACPEMDPANFSPYPTLLQHADVDMNEEGVTAGKPVISSDGAIRVQLTVDPSKIGVNALLRKLNFWQSSKVIDTFSVVTEATATLSISYEMLANFVQNYYMEQVCYKQRECITAFGAEIACWTNSWCDNIPRYFEEFSNLDLTSHYKMYNERGVDVPHYKLEKLQQELLSDAMVEAFQAKYVENIGEIVKVTPGKLTKNLKDNYEKTRSIQRAVNNSINGFIRVYGIGDALKPALSAIYASPEMACLSKQKRPYLTTNPCFEN